MTENGEEVLWDVDKEKVVNAKGIQRYIHETWTIKSKRQRFSKSKLDMVKLFMFPKCMC